MNKTVLVTGIGGNVGQGILRNIQSYKYDITLIGTNTEAVSGGNHLCDKTYIVPFSSSTDYVPAMKRICKKENVNLIIPSTDFEMYFLAVAADQLPPIAGSDSKIAKIFLNKYQTWLEFNKSSIPFAQTSLPSQYNDGFGEIILKPAEGRGSRDIHINPSNPKDYSDDYVIQKLYKGQEITTAFYVTKKGELLGQITFKRSLNNGATNICEVTFDFDKNIQNLIEKIISKYKIVGSCNLQAIVDAEGNIWPFELNCRISGTNSIRGQFGFEDVKYTIEECLYNKTPEKLVIKKGSAVRILMDVIYPDTGLEDIKDKNTKNYIF